MKLNLAIISLILLGLASCSTPAQPSDNSPAAYKMMSVSELQALRDSGEDFLFVNVHIPLEGNIPGTDFTVPFNQIEQNLDLFPEDKDARIVIYCRSDNMGHDAGQALVDNGYTDVSNLEGGYIEWKAQGLPFEE